MRDPRPRTGQLPQVGGEDLSRSDGKLGESPNYSFKKYTSAASVDPMGCKRHTSSDGRSMSASVT